MSPQHLNALAEHDPLQQPNLRSSPVTAIVMMPAVIAPVRAVVTITIDGIIAVTIIARTVIPITMDRIVGGTIIGVAAVIVTMVVAVMIEAPQYQG